MRADTCKQDQTLQPRSSDPCWPTLVGSQVWSCSHCLQRFVNARTELFDWHHHVPCSVSSFTFLQQKLITERPPTASSLIARSLNPHLRCGTIYHSMSSQTFPI